MVTQSYLNIGLSDGQNQLFNYLILLSLIWDDKTMNHYNQQLWSQSQRRVQTQAPNQKCKSGC